MQKSRMQATQWRTRRDIIAKVLGNEGKYFSSDGQRVYARYFFGAEIQPKHLDFSLFFVSFYFLPHPMHGCY
jgi:hypothetical protein